MNDEPVKEAARQLSDLNTFAIVVTILEGGHLMGRSHDDAARIIKIAKAAQQKCLHRHDRALLAARKEAE